MNFIIRPAKEGDLESLFDLAKQFTLLNLPANKKEIEKKILKSQKSFKGELDKSEALYFFVCEDLEDGLLAGCSQVVAKKGTPTNPNYSFKVLKRERFSPDLSVGFIHQILRLHLDMDGGTEVGGLILDKSYRRRPEKLGRLISLSRFVYIGMNQDRFEDELLAEMAPPLTDEGRSEFWEALGRRFTGMPYQEADALSQTNKEFIRSLFPEEDIYLCLLDPKARLVLGRVGPETGPALHMLESIGFKYKNEVDPFDGGPHYGVKKQDVSLIKKGSFYKYAEGEVESYEVHPGLVAVGKNEDFKCTRTAYKIIDDKVYLPELAAQALQLQSGEQIYLTVYQ
ncbi:MAG: arginine N-succinyltransferase [Bdellovibrionales bacterium]|nr:arginine N-succinyltransferase [Bdellovibrionales bacterium]